MDIKLRRRKRSLKRVVERNFRAWKGRFADDDLVCRHCPHDNKTHLCVSGQPHFFTVDGRRKIVSRNVEIVRAFCTACAEEIGASQALCYQRNIAVGERLGRM